MADSPVSLIEDWAVEDVGGSFTQPLTDPGVDPTTGPQVCIHIHRAWQPYLAGAALQLLLPASWEYADDTALDAIMDEAILVFNAVATAERCPAADMVTVTILAGAATGTAAVTFSTPFSAAPVVTVSGDSGSVICSAESITTTGFTARITSGVELLANHDEHVSWNAMLAA